jgi:hypothetical protein
VSTNFAIWQYLLYIQKHITEWNSKHILRITHETGIQLIYIFRCHDLMEPYTSSPVNYSSVLTSSHPQTRHTRHKITSIRNLTGRLYLRLNFSNILNFFLCYVSAHMPQKCISVQRQINLRWAISKLDTSKNGGLTTVL